MAFCKKCGTEVTGDAALCPKCQQGATQETPAVPVKKKRKLTIWFILGAVALLIGIICFILFRPHDIKLGDIKEVSTVGAVINYGWPESFKTDEYGETYLTYEDLTFYGITPATCGVYPEEDTVVFFFNESDQDNVQRILSSRCHLEEYNVYLTYRYDDLTITTDSDCFYVSIQIG